MSDSVKREFEFSREILESFADRFSDEDLESSIRRRELMGFVTQLIAQQGLDGILGDMLQEARDGDEFVYMVVTWVLLAMTIPGKGGEVLVVIREGSDQEPSEGLN